VRKQTPARPVRFCFEARLSGNPSWCEFVVDSSNDPRGDAGGRTEESQVATGSTASPEASLDLFYNASGFPDSLKQKEQRAG
jgi:hypothetical protein